MEKDSKRDKFNKSIIIFTVGSIIGTLVALIILGFFIYMLFRPERSNKKVSNTIDFEVN